MKKSIPAVLLLLLCQLTSWAQQQPQFTHYGFNGMYISPAYAGITNRPEIQSVYRYQWLNYDATLDDGGSPRTLMLTAHTPVRLLRGGLGLTLVQDQVANTRIQQAALSYSFHLNVGEGRLGIGVQGNMNNIRKGSYRFIDAGDPRIPENSNDSKFDMGAGVWYESERFYAGGGVTNLLRSSYQFMDAGNTGGGRVVGENHIYVTGGYHLDLTSQLVLTPTALVKRDKETFSFDAGARVTFDEKYWGGLNYRHQEAVSALMGIAMLQDNALRVGYALDLTTFSKQAKAPTSHEVMVSYRLPEPVVRFRPPVRTPRYNFTK